MRGRGNRVPVATENPKPLKEIRSVLYEDHQEKSIVSETALQQNQSNHIGLEEASQAANDVPSQSRNYFKQERNTIMAGDLRDEERVKF